MATPGMDPLFGEIISSYSRAQAIEDGELVDVTAVAKEAGIKFPVAITRAVWAEYITPDPRAVRFGQSVEGRLWDTMWMLRTAARRGGDTIRFQVYFIMQERRSRLITLKATCGPGDTAEPTITVMLVEES